LNALAAHQATGPRPGRARSAAVPERADLPVGPDAQQRVPNGAPHIFYALVLWLQAGLFGTFTALNFFHWFLFWELGLIPAFFPDQTLGRIQARTGGYAVLHLHDGRQRGVAVEFFAY